MVINNDHITNNIVTIIKHNKNNGTNDHESKEVKPIDKLLTKIKRENASLDNVPNLSQIKQVTSMLFRDKIVENNPIKDEINRINKCREVGAFKIKNSVQNKLHEI